MKLYLVILLVLCLLIILCRCIIIKRSVDKADNIIKFTKYRKGQKVTIKKKK